MWAYWSLTVEPLWYELILDTQVPAFTYISLFELFVSFDSPHGFIGCRCCILLSGAPLRTCGCEQTPAYFHKEAFWGFGKNEALM